MKKIILTLALLAATAATTQTLAQQKNPRWWAGGSIGFNSSEASGNINSESNSFSIAPEVVYNFSDRWGAGLRLGVYTFDSERHGDGIEEDTRGFSVAPFARYSFARWRGVTFFADGGLIYSSSDDEGHNDGNYSTVEQRRIGLFVDPGFSVRISRHLAMTARTNIFTAGYSAHRTSSYGAANETLSWNAKVNSPFSVDDFLGSFTLGFSLTFD